MYRTLILGIRVFLGLIFFTAGMAKIYYLYGAMFPGLIGPPWLEERLVQYGLGFFAQFIAYAQLLVGLLLLTQRFATIGAVMLFPMLLCIYIVTVSLQWQGTPYVNFFLLVLNGSLLAHDFPKLKFLLAEEGAPLPALHPVRQYPQLDWLWAGSIGIIVLSTITVRYSALLSYGLVLLGIVLAVTCQLWQRRKQKNTNLPSNP